MFGLSIIDLANLAPKLILPLVLIVWCMALPPRPAHAAGAKPLNLLAVFWETLIASLRHAPLAILLLTFVAAAIAAAIGLVSAHSQRAPQGLIPQIAAAGLFGIWIAGLVVATLAYSACVFVWHRAILRKSAERAGIRLVDGSYWGVFAAAVTITLIWFAAYIGFALAIAFTSFISATAVRQLGSVTIGPGEGILILAVVSFVFGTLVVLVAVPLARLAMIFPAFAVGEGVSFGESFKRANGLGPLLAAGMFTFQAIGVIASFALVYVANSVKTPLNVQLLLVFGGIAIFGGVLFLLGISFVSVVYRRWVLEPKTTAIQEVGKVAADG